MNPTKHFIAVGGGIGGLAAALVLAKDGHRVTVLEQSAEFGEIGAGIQLGPNVFKMFAYLGLTEQIDAVAHFPSNMGMRDIVTDEPVVSVDLRHAPKQLYGYGYGVIYRADLHAVLLAACRRLASIELITSAKFESFTQSADAVRVSLVGGDIMQADGLIGCDGLWSGIRQAIVGDGAPRVSGHIAYRAVLPRAEVPAHLWCDDVRLWGGEKTHLVTYPLRRGELFNLVAVFHSSKFDRGWDTFGDTTELNARFEHACSPVKELLAKINLWKMWVLCDREPVKNWTLGRATLLGDAAHPMLQYLAQGAGQAIEDAATLGAALRHHPGDVGAAWQAYNDARYLRTGRVQLTARLYGDIYHASGVQRELRNQMFQSGTESAGFAGLKWMYEGIEPDAMFGQTSGENQAASNQPPN